jgi:hypothetical protein
MVYFQTKDPNLGKFWRVWQWKMLVVFRAILSILQTNGIVYGHLVHFVVICYIFSCVGMYVVPGKIWQPWWVAFFRDFFGIFLQHAWSESWLIVQEPIRRSRVITPAM